MPFTADLGEVDRKVAALRHPEFRLCVDNAMMEEASQLLARSRGVSNTLDVIVFLSDSFDWKVAAGFPCSYIPRQTLNAARSAKNQGTQIIASCHSDTGVWNATGGHGYLDCHSSDFGLIASSADLYVDNGDRFGTVAVYEAMARKVTRGAYLATVSQVDITDTLSAHFDLVPDSLRPVGGFDPATRAVTWAVPISDTYAITASYRVQPRDVGTWPVNVGARLSYTDSQGRLGSLALPSAVITVTGPCETPTPLPTPTPTVTDTPVPPSATATTPATDTPAATMTPVTTPTRVPVPVYLPVLLRERCRPKHEGADVALVLDTSGSMAGAKLADAKSAALTFIALMDLASAADQVAVVRFDTDAQVVAHLTNDRAALDAAVRALTARTGTYIDRGLDTALGELQSARHVATNEPVLVLLTDGVQTGTPGAELTAAARVRAAGVRLYAIGLGSDVDEATLVAVAGERSRYYYAPGSAELEGIYRAIARDIACPPERLWGRR